METLIQGDVNTAVEERHNKHGIYSFLSCTRLVCQVKSRQHGGNCSCIT